MQKTMAAKRTLQVVEEAHKPIPNYAQFFRKPRCRTREDGMLYGRKFLSLYLDKFEKYKCNKEKSKSCLSKIGSFEWLQGESSLKWLICFTIEECED